MINGVMDLSDQIAGSVRVDRITQADQADYRLGDQVRK